MNAVPTVRRVPVIDGVPVVHVASRLHPLRPLTGVPGQLQPPSCATWLHPQCRASPVSSTAPSSRTASHPGAVWGAWQPPSSAASCMSPTLFAACGRILLTRHPAPWLGGWLGVLQAHPASPPHRCEPKASHTPLLGCDGWTHSSEPAVLISRVIKRLVPAAPLPHSSGVPAAAAWAAGSSGAVQRQTW